VIDGDDAMTRKTKIHLTEAEFLALPDDGVDRWLVNGEVWEFGASEHGMTVRDPMHGRATARIGQILGNWVDVQPTPRGDIVGGEVGFRFQGESATVVALDVAYIDSAFASQSPEVVLLEGAPILAVEVLSPQDTMGFISDRVKILLSAGVKIVWVVDTFDQSVRVRRKGVPSQTLDTTQELTAEPELPGFRVSVASLFSRG
jgi:Uma2 family endonuclease